MSTTTTRRPSWADQRAKVARVKPAEVAETICTDPDTIAAVSHAEHALLAAKARAMARLAQENAGTDTKPSQDDILAAVAVDPEVIAASDDLAVARAAYDDATVEFFFRALPRDQYNALQALHPPSDDDRAKGKRVNDDTFGPAIVAACHVYRVPAGADDDGKPVWDEYPGMDEDEARQYLTTWNQGDATTLYSSAVAVNEMSRIDLVALGKAFGPTPR